MALNAKQARFVEEYLIDLNATQAAIRAGYSENSAYSQAHDLLKKPEIETAIQEAQKRRSERTQVTQDMVVDELRKIGFSDIRKVAAWGERPVLEDLHEDDDLRTYPVELIASENIDDDTAAAVSEVSLTAQGVKVKMHDKRSALVDLGKHLGMFVQRVEHTGKDGKPIETITTEMNAKEASEIYAATVANDKG